MPQGYRQQLGRIQNQLAPLDFLFELDLTLTIAGDMITVTYPTGLRSPRVNKEKKRVTGSIFISSKDVKAIREPERFLSNVNFFKRLSKFFTALTKRKNPPHRNSILKLKFKK